MKDIYIADLTVGQEFMGYFMVRQLAVKKASNGRNYMDLMLADKTGEISAKKWDLADEALERERQYGPGDVIKVAAQVTEFKGMKQLRLSRIRMTNKEDNIDITDYIKAAPESGPSMYEFIYSAAMDMADLDLAKLCTMQLEKYKEKLLYYPAASKNHHAEMCGLLWHMKRMLMSGQALCKVYTNLDPDLVSAGVILHDLQKTTEILSDELGVSSGYSFEGKMLGHLVLGVRELDKDMTALQFSDEKRIMIEHMILSHHYEPEFGSPVRPLFPEAEMLHYLDVLDAKMYDMEDALLGIQPGDFSERVWTLNNRTIYKRKNG